MLSLQNISYTHPDKDLLFNSISLSLNAKEKTALIGNNGSGKSTLLKLIAGELLPASGKISVESAPYYLPQIFGQFDHLTVAEALGIKERLSALHAILAGHGTEEFFNILNDDWTIEERALEALKYWALDEVSLDQKLGTLSGGEKTKVFLAGISIHQAELILLDEPSNHLDLKARNLLYEFIRSADVTALLVSHDRKLLNMLEKVYVLDSGGIKLYGGNYAFYAEQREIELNALNEDLKSQEKALRAAREKEREAAERKNRLDSRGKKKQEKAGVARIMINTMRNNAEKSSSKLKSVHTEKIAAIKDDYQNLRSSVPDINKMKLDLEDSGIHKGKVLFSANRINFSFTNKPTWKEDLSIEIRSGERVALSGANGSGKTTLIKIILGELEPRRGSVKRQFNKVIYVDQDYSLIDDTLTVYEQAQQFNDSGLQEHEIKLRLNRYLFGKESWSKSCRVLSGGEKMRLILACLTMSDTPPDMIILDEPTNNIDIENVEILIAGVNEYKGALVVVSHDDGFVESINLERTIGLSKGDWKPFEREMLD